MMPDSTNSALINAKGSSDIPLAGIFLIAHDNKLRESGLRNFGVRAIVSPRKSLLYITIQSVIGSRSNPKMVRSNAGRIIAFVKHAHSFWNWSIVKKPRCSMRFDSSSAFDICVKPSVTVGVQVSRPNPTTLIVCDKKNPLPKLFSKVRTQSLRGKVIRGNLDVRSIHSNLCRALGRFSAAEAFTLSLI
jgi:hypothetical protein